MPAASQRAAKTVAPSSVNAACRANVPRASRTSARRAPVLAGEDRSRVVLVGVAVQDGDVQECVSAEQDAAERAVVGSPGVVEAWLAVVDQQRLDVPQPVELHVCALVDQRLGQHRRPLLRVEGELYHARGVRTRCAVDVAVGRLEGHECPAAGQYVRHCLGPGREQEREGGAHGMIEVGPRRRKHRLVIDVVTTQLGVGSDVDDFDARRR